MVSAKSITIPPDFLAKPTPPTGTAVASPKPDSPARGASRPVSKLRAAPISATQGDEYGSGEFTSDQDTETESQSQGYP